VKALIKKIWYLRDHGTVATTNPAVHPQGQPTLVTGLTDHPHPGKILHPVMIKPITNPLKNTAATAQAKRSLFLLREASPTKAKKVGAMAIQAASATVQAKRNLSVLKAGLTAAAQPMARLQAIENPSPLKAARTPAG